MANDEAGFISSFKKLVSRRSSSITVPDGYIYQPVSTLSSLKHLLAVFVDDLEPQKEYYASTPRHVGRMGVTLATIVAFAAMAIFIFKSPSVRAVRNWAPDPVRKWAYRLHHQCPLFPTMKTSHPEKNFDFKDSDTQYFNDTSQICFCRKTNINWPDYVAFFPLTKMSGDGNTNPTLKKGDNITHWVDFCHGTILAPTNSKENSSQLARDACFIMVEAVVAPNISQTCLESASLIGSSLLNDTIGSRVRGGLDQIFWNYILLRSLHNTQEDYDLIASLYYLWTTMLEQFYKNHMSSYEDYWNAANKNKVLTVINGNQTALGMDIFWYKYANICNPPFCDLVVQNSWQYNCFLVIAQVGGISTFALLFIRIIFWPALRYLFGWPLLFRSENAQQMNQPQYICRKISGKVESLEGDMPAAAALPDTS